MLVEEPLPIEPVLLGDFVVDELELGELDEPEPMLDPVLEPVLLPVLDDDVPPAAPELLEPDLSK